MNQISLAQQKSRVKSLSDYKILEMIGDGSFGKVYKAIEISTQKIVAMKKVRMQHSGEGISVSTLREIKILKMLDHPNILKLLDIAIKRYGQSTHIYLVLEFMQHDLAGLLENSAVTFTHSQIKLYIRQLLQAIEYLHENHVIHRDIKSSNILINNDGRLVLGDWGMSKVVQEGNVLTNNVITLYYRPPEIILGDTSYNQSVDMWSFGCILGEMFYGKPILSGKDPFDQMDRIYRLCGSPTDFDMHKYPRYHELGANRKHKRKLTESFHRFPSDVVDLIDKCLVLDPSKRLTAKMALQHDYFKNLPCEDEIGKLPAMATSFEYLMKRKKVLEYKENGRDPYEWK